MTGRILFYVQHLLGMGHLVRALRVARGLEAGGFAVRLVLGGPSSGLDLGGLEVVQLTPLKAGAQGFGDLVTLDGEPAGPEVKARRCRELLAAFAAARPDVLLVEAFPFGRRQVRFELLPLLAAAHERRPRPLVVCSIRDILQESAKPARAGDTVDTLRRYFDHVIVHGDPRLVALDATFPLARELAAMVSYSGLVAPAGQPSTGPGPFEVIVSAGGGAVGRRLLETAVAAKAQCTLAGARWLAVTGPNAAAADFAALAARAADVGVAVERFVPDLVRLLAGARLSISQAGYNTVADVLVAGCRAVFVPFAAAGETEQTRRAALLGEHGLGVAVAEADLAPAALADAVDRALALPASGARFDLGGAAGTAAILRRLLEQGPRAAP